MYPFADPNELSDEDLNKLESELIRKHTLSHRYHTGQPITASLEILLDEIRLIKQERYLKSIQNMDKTAWSYDTEEYWKKSKENNSYSWLSRPPDTDEEAIENAVEKNNMTQKLSETQLKFKEWQASQIAGTLPKPTTEKKPRGRPRKPIDPNPPAKRPRGRPRKHPTVE